MKRAIIAFLFLAGLALATTNEITSNITIKVNKDATQLDRRSGNIQIQMAGQRFNIQTIMATTTNQRLSKGSVGTPGVCYMRNLSTNSNEKTFVSFDSGTTTSLVFEAEEAGTFRLDYDAIVTNIMVATTNGTCDFEFTVIED